MDESSESDGSQRRDVIRKLTYSEGVVSSSKGAISAGGGGSKSMPMPSIGSGSSRRQMKQRLIRMDLTVVKRWAGDMVMTDEKRVTSCCDGL